MTEIAIPYQGSAVAMVARRRKTLRRAGLQAFLIVMSLIWLLPLLWAVYTSFRPYADTAGDPRGYVSIGGAYNFGNYIAAWNQGEFPKYFLNTVIVMVPAVILVLLLASMMAFTVSRYSWRLNLSLLMLFTAANLLPPQVIITPLFRIFLALPLPPFLSDNGVFYDQYIGLTTIHVAFQLGFCTFVLSNYMKALPKELTEAALVDGASVWRQYAEIIMPLCRPALAAMGTLEVIFIYNDFFWPLLFIQSGDRLPVTTGIKNLQGDFLSNYNLIAAGAVITIIPTLVVYLLLQRHFVAGLTLGATKA